MNWLNNLDEGALVETLRGTHASHHLSDLTFEEFGHELALDVSPSERGFGMGGQLWDRLKEEFRLLMCGGSPKYDDLRKKLDGLSNQSTTAFVALISGSLGSVIGVAATVVAPLVALLLLATIRVSLSTYCAREDDLEERRIIIPS
jgi:hypothetical protein